MVSRPQALSEQDLRDLGFGSVVSRESQQRLLNRDGSFNVRRRGLGFWSSFSLYHALLTISWSHFFFIIYLLPRQDIKFCSLMTLKVIKMTFCIL